MRVRQDIIYSSSVHDLESDGKGHGNCAICGKPEWGISDLSGLRVHYRYINSENQTQKSVIPGSFEANLTAIARNIVNQILDEAETSVEKRQAINDSCDVFVTRMLHQALLLIPDDVRPR